MKPPLSSWDLIAQLTDLSQFFPLIGFIPPLWQVVFAIVLFSLLSVSLLLVICHQLLTIRAFPKTRDQRQISSSKANSRPPDTHALKHQRHRPRWRRHYGRKMHRAR